MRAIALNLLVAMLVTVGALWIYRWQQRRRTQRDRVLGRLSPRWLDDQRDRR